jgi:hypothetical protein
VDREEGEREKIEEKEKRERPISGAEVKRRSISQWQKRFIFLLKKCLISTLFLLLKSLNWGEKKEILLLLLSLSLKSLLLLVSPPPSYLQGSISQLQE